MTDTPRYLLLATKTLRELTERDVHLDAIEDIESIYEIILTARRVLEPTDPALARRILSPKVRLECGVVLEALPVGVQHALWELLESGRYTKQDISIAQAYAAAHAQESEFWQAPPSPRRFRRIIRKWARGIDATVIEIKAALQEMKIREYESLIAVKGGGSGIGWLRLLEMLVQEYGRDEDYWTWEASSELIESIISARNDRVEAEERELMRTSPKGGKDMPKLSANSYQVRSMDTLIRLRDSIVEEKRKQLKA